MTTVEERHTRSVGALVVNLQSLEFFLRVLLSRIYDSDDNGLMPGMPQDLNGLQVGQTVPLNHMTNYGTLEELLIEYNDYVGGKDASLIIDGRVVDLRDALAHGRVFMGESYSRYQLLKFDKPRRQQVRVVFSRAMDEQWFRSQSRFVIAQCKKAHRAAELFEPSVVVSPWPAGL